jgi:hypothetical protein
VAAGGKTVIDEKGEDDLAASLEAEGEILASEAGPGAVAFHAIEWGGSVRPAMPEHPLRAHVTDMVSGRKADPFRRLKCRERGKCAHGGDAFAHRCLALLGLHYHPRAGDRVTQAAETPVKQ